MAMMALLLRYIEYLAFTFDDIVTIQSFHLTGFTCGSMEASSRYFARFDMYATTLTMQFDGKLPVKSSVASVSLIILRFCTHTSTVKFFAYWIVFLLTIILDVRVK
uniref:Uncharacterized protein n=1 Tax=Glossina pallidipes TaxID=7398 RepID=A0A1A9Z2Y5_GLOPL